MLRILGSVLIALLVVSVLATPSQAGSIRVGHKISAEAREREIDRNEQFYLKLSATRSSRPLKFDRAHPFYGRLLTDRDYFDDLFERWQANPARFEHYHPCAWRILDGGAHLNPPGGQEVIPPPPPIPQEPNPPEPPGPGPTPTAVPEPSSVMLVLTGVGLVFVSRAASRRFRK